MNNSQSASGIVLIGDNPAILVSHPILTTRGEGEPAGTLLMGRFLDRNEMENIFNINRENVTIYSYFNTQLPPDLLEAKENLNQRQDYIKILDGNKIASYSLINGINGTPSVIVRSEVPRVLAEFQNTVFYYIVLILIMGLLNGMVIIYYLDWKILNRLEGMSRQVLKMGSDKDISKRLPDYGDDELGNLGKSINQMLGSIEKSDAQIKISLKEKEILLREIHHRTKNNLQIIAALLEMQADEADDPRLNEFFRESQNRIHAMSMVHENLYMSTNLSRIALDSYLKNLVEDLIYSYKELEAKIKLKMDVDPIKINIESTIPCGLIVTEIVSNALKHAFKGFDYGEIYVGAYYEEDYIVLEIKDNGVGIPDDVKLDGSTGLGLQLVETFVEQLEGSISINRDQGTSFTIKFKEIKYRERM
jgi:two-component sensor histidine kinase